VTSDALISAPRNRKKEFTHLLVTSDALISAPRNRKKEFTHLLVTSDALISAPRNRKKDFTHHDTFKDEALTTTKCTGFLSSSSSCLYLVSSAYQTSSCRLHEGQDVLL